MPLPSNYPSSQHSHRPIGTWAQLLGIYDGSDFQNVCQVQVMEPIADRSTLICGHRIAYGIYGQGEPVVFLHGTPSSSLIWRNVVPRLTVAGYQIHVYDLLGYGCSERPWGNSVDTSISGQVPVLIELLSFWQLGEVHLVAHDIGGGIAQRFSIFHPDRIKTLTMVDVVSFDSYPSSRTRQRMQKGLDNLTRTESNEHRAHFQEWLLSAVHNPDKLTSSSLETYLEYISGSIGQPSLFQHQIRHYDPKHTMEIADRYHELGRLPVRLIWGAHDAWQVLGWAHKLQEAIPGSDLSVIENCGHFSPEDQPEKLAEILLAFLARYHSKIPNQSGHADGLASSLLNSDAESVSCTQVKGQGIM